MFQIKFDCKDKAVRMESGKYKFVTKDHKFVTGLSEVSLKIFPRRVSNLTQSGQDIPNTILIKKGVKGFCSGRVGAVFQSVASFRSRSDLDEILKRKFAFSLDFDCDLRFFLLGLLYFLIQMFDDFVDTFVRNHHLLVVASALV